MKHLILLLGLPGLFTLVSCEALGPMPDFGYGGARGGDSNPWQNEPASQRRTSYTAEERRHEPSRRADSGSSWSSSASQRHQPAPYPLDGTVTESYSGNRTYRDKYSGQIIGSESTSPAGRTTYRDADGSMTGYSDTSSTGTTTYRKSSGEISTTSSTTQGTGGDSTTTYRNASGQIIGNKYVSPAGNVTWRDGSGRIVDGPSGMKP